MYYRLILYLVSASARVLGLEFSADDADSQLQARSGLEPQCVSSRQVPTLTNIFAPRLEEGFIQSTKTITLCPGPCNYLQFALKITSEMGPMSEYRIR